MKHATIVNFYHSIFKKMVVRWCEVSVKNNSLICKFNWTGSSIGSVDFNYTYTYSKGTLKRSSLMTSNFKLYPSPENYLTTAKKLPVYYNTEKKVKFNIPKGKKISVTRIYFTAQNGVWYEIKYGSKKGWIPDTGYGPFKNAVFAPA